MCENCSKVSQNEIFNSEVFVCSCLPGSWQTWICGRCL